MKLDLDYRLATGIFQNHMTAFSRTFEAMADQAVRQSMEEAGARMDTTVPVDTGALHSNRSAVTSTKPLTWGTGYSLDYATILEYGGYRRVGPKTVRLGGGEIGEGFVGAAGIYAKQAPMGWVRKAMVVTREPFARRVNAAVRQAWTGQGATGHTPANALTMDTGEPGALFGIPLG